MDLGFTGHTVFGTGFDYTVAVHFGGGYEVRGEVKFTLRIDGLERALEPGRDAATSARWL